METHRECQGETDTDRGAATTNHGLPGTSRSSKRQKGAAPGASEEARPCPHLTFRLLASRPGTE